MTAPLAMRSFSWEHQRLFAEITGDVNPMHMDEYGASRTQAGSPVVHGMHVMIWALDILLRQGVLASVSSVRCKFLKFVFIDQPVTLRVIQSDDKRIRAAVEVDGAPTVELTIFFKPRVSPVESQLADAKDVEVGSTPRVQDVDTLRGYTGWITPSPDAAGRLGELYPAVCAALSERSAISVALFSTLVGMVAPGMHSILSEVSFDFAENDVGRSGLGFGVDPVDERFRTVPMRVVGPKVNGAVASFLRAEPVPLPTMAEAIAQVEPNAFAGQSALIVGGSRGLGAATAMLLAAGGAEVGLTYHRSLAEAEKLSTAISAVSDSRPCQIVRYDVSGEPSEQLVGIQRPTHLYYFATPKIFRQGAALFSRPVFDEFVDVYLTGFMKLFSYLNRPGEKLAILYPSSVAVSSRPKGMTEYAMAKIAGEELCKDLQRNSPGVRILTPRLPRILTDQTATVPPVPSEDAMRKLLPLLHECA